MQRFQDIVSKVELTLTATLLALIVILVFTAAASRYVLTPINWSVDAAQALFVWVVFLGASQALRRRRHLGISVLVDMLSKNQRTWIDIVLRSLIAIFLAFIIYYGIKLCILNYGRKLTSFPLSYSYVTLAAPVGCTLMLITTVHQICVDLKLVSSRRSSN